MLQSLECPDYPLTQKTTSGVQDIQVTGDDMPLSLCTLLQTPSTSVPPWNKTWTPPLNNTLNSMGSMKVILIQILPAEDYDVREPLTNPLLLNKIIYKSPFATLLNISDIRINIRRTLVAIENSTMLTDHETTQLLKITNLDKYKINCYLPNSDILQSGVISPISINTDLAEFKRGN